MGLLYPMWWDNSEYSDVTTDADRTFQTLCAMELDIPSLYNNVPYFLLEVLLYVALFEVQSALLMHLRQSESLLLVRCVVTVMKRTYMHAGALLLSKGVV